MVAYNYPVGPALTDMGPFSQGRGYGTATGVVAHAGGTQAAAQQMPLASVVWIDVCATNGDSITLPPADGNQYITVINNGAANCSVYSSNATPTDLINGVAGSTPQSIVAGKVCNFISKPGAWRALVSA